MTFQGIFLSSIKKKRSFSSQPLGAPKNCMEEVAGRTSSRACVDLGNQDPLSEAGGGAWRLIRSSQALTVVEVTMRLTQIRASGGEGLEGR